MKNPFLLLRSWVFFVISHLWWVIFALSANLCTGALGAGTHCNPVWFEDIATWGELSTIAIVPVIAPLLFYFWCINRWREYHNKKPLSPFILLAIIFSLAIAYVTIGSLAIS